MKACIAQENVSKTTFEDSNLEKKAKNFLIDYIRYPQCKRLINRIFTAQKTNNFKSVAVISQFPEEGKTVFTAVLALGFHMFLDKRVLIMDTVSQTRDESFYYRGLLGHSLLELDQKKKQSCIDLITTRNVGSKIRFQHLQTPDKSTEVEIPDFNQDQDSDVTSDFKLCGFIESMKSNYDLILLDTCALSTANKYNFDPLILAQHADTSILVTTPRSLDRGLLKELTQELRRYNVSSLGMVVNPVVA